ncbi:hypothetical protein DF030_14170 [Burkholderia cenocepacia]|nr:hypothetical protein DF030_14170 [Burkholderia cenocepacia]
MISAANFHSCFGRWNSTGRYLNFNEIVVQQLRVGHSDYRFMRINEVVEIGLLVGTACGRWRDSRRRAVDAVLDGGIFTCPIAGAVRRGDISECCPFAGRGEWPASRKFVRIKSAAVRVIDFVAGVIGIRHREVCSVGRRQTHGYEARR